MYIGQKIKEARIKKQLTQKKLANLIGAKHSTVCEWESGKRNPDANYILKICNVLNVDPNYMFAWEEANKKYDELEKQNKLFKIENLTKEQREEVYRYAKYIKSFDEKD